MPALMLFKNQTYVLNVARPLFEYCSVSSQPLRLMVDHLETPPQELPLSQTEGRSTHPDTKVVYNLRTQVIDTQYVSAISWYSSKREL